MQNACSGAKNIPSKKPVIESTCLYGRASAILVASASVLTSDDSPKSSKILLTILLLVERRLSWGSYEWLNLHKKS